MPRALLPLVLHEFHHGSARLRPSCTLTSISWRAKNNSAWALLLRPIVTVVFLLPKAPLTDLFHFGQTPALVTNNNCAASRSGIVCNSHFPCNRYRSCALCYAVKVATQQYISKTVKSACRQERSSRRAIISSHSGVGQNSKGPVALAFD